MKRTAAIAVLLAAVLAGSASANTAFIKYTGPGQYCGVAGFQVDFDDDGTWDRSYNGNVYTGDYKFAFDASQSSKEAVDLLSDPFYAWCIDVDQNAPTAWATYEIKDLEQAPINDWAVMGDARADSVRELFGRFRGLVNSVEEGEAFAAALWEIVYEQDASYDLDDGTLVMNGLDGGPQGHAKTIAEGWLGQLDGTESMFDDDVFALTNGTYQDFALTSPNYDEPPPIPEPVTTIGLLLGGAALTAYSRRRRTREGA